MQRGAVVEMELHAQKMVFLHLKILLLRKETVEHKGSLQTCDHPLISSVKIGEFVFEPILNDLTRPFSLVKGATKVTQSRT